jgi:hypothetical protein
MVDYYIVTYVILHETQSYGVFLIRVYRELHIPRIVWTPISNPIKLSISNCKGQMLLHNVHHPPLHSTCSLASSSSVKVHSNVHYTHTVLPQRALPLVEDGKINMILHALKTNYKVLDILIPHKLPIRLQ